MEALKKGFHWTGKFDTLRNSSYDRNSMNSLIHVEFQCPEIWDPRIFVGFVLLDLYFYVYVLKIVVCPFLFHLVIVLSVCPSSIYGFWLHLWYLQTRLVDVFKMRSWALCFIIWFLNLQRVQMMLTHQKHQVLLNVSLWEGRGCCLRFSFVFLIFIIRVLHCSLICSYPHSSCKSL